MPPRRNIVKSGNAGTSSKSNKPKVEDASGKGNATAVNASSASPSLFPPGSKTPLSLLHERCQKNDWEKPEVQTFQRGNTYSAAVIVKRHNSRTSQTEVVRFEPRPPLEMKTPLEAKHWAATYALYRFCNNIQLHRVLPPGPRQYWMQLVEEHKVAPEHLKWYYEPDPFAAKASVEARQREAATRKEKAKTGNDDDLEVFHREIEVKMGPSLREAVQSAVKKAFAEFPEIGDDTSPLVDDSTLAKSLSSLGFKASSITATLQGLSSNSSFAGSLLSHLPPLEAALEYLLLHTPESDLPTQFTPNRGSSGSFISSIHDGNESLKQRWLEDRAVKDAGYPRVAVKGVLKTIKDPTDIVFEFLTHKLVGQAFPDNYGDSFDMESRDICRQEEIEAIQAIFPEALFDEKLSTMAIPLESPATYLNVMYSPDHPYPLSTRLPPFYISSSTLPAYQRLHLVTCIARDVAPSGQRHEGESICFNAVEIANKSFEEMEVNGPPSMEEVLQSLLPPPEPKPKPKRDRTEGLPSDIRRIPRRPLVSDRRSHDRILEEFQTLKGTDAYLEMEKQRKKLPAWAYKHQLVNTIERNQVTIVVGETGCGKTTQLPQFVLDAEIESKRGAITQIIVTQPRRVSVLGVSSRVSAERVDDGSIGYAIRGESKTSPSTKLLFCTTGVLLRRLASGDDLGSVSHVIVDEVHERSVDSDFLLLELRDMIKTRKSLKIVLMSATINQAIFSGYFDGAPVIEIPGRTFPVTDVFLEDIVELLKYKPSPAPGRKKFTAEQSQLFRSFFEEKGLESDTINYLESIRRTDRIDHQLVALIVRHIVTVNETGAILIFMPGVQEIRMCMEAIQALSIGRISILPLHANLSSDEQRRIFSPTPWRKVIVATNIAETSITIDDVVFVIDCGKLKETRYDSETGISRLEEMLETQASASQRRGRAGRVQSGTCYRLFTSKDWKDMRNFPIPEIQRVPLESLSLQAKLMHPHEDAKSYLSRAIDPPSTVAMEQAWQVLGDLGAVDADDNLTALGRYMGMLPMDLRLGKILILGSIFGCLSPALSIAACLSSKSLFVSPIDKREEADQARQRFATDNSDILTTVNALDQCFALRNEGKLASFCEENFLSFSAVREISALRMEFASSLSDLGFTPFGADPHDSRLNRNSRNINLVKAMILGGLWPRIVKVVPPRAVFDKIASGTQQREHQAREVKYFDQQEGRVFLHPSSTLFSQTTYKSRFLAYFTKIHTSKVYLRDLTEIPLYGLLLFGGTVTIKHTTGHITVGSDWVKLKAVARIGVLVNQLRRLLDEKMQKSLDTATLLGISDEDPIVEAILALLTRDGVDHEAI
ncbi:hypothetical protein FRB91_003631 [Serendipita sp. 411]|nr:hypothetical protein FRC15_003222 [Serendipita sp. 397]KAG8854348.1 hypothetical protein FRB91_003631 [Serendipita sp. 411]